MQWFIALGVLLVAGALAGRRAARHPTDGLERPSPKGGLQDASSEGSALVQLARFRDARGVRGEPKLRPILLTAERTVLDARLPDGWLALRGDAR